MGSRPERGRESEECGEQLDARYRIRQEVNAFQALLAVQEVHDNIIELLDVVASESRAGLRNSI